MDKQKAAAVLLWAVRYGKIEVGEGAKVGEGCGSGLRHIDAPLYNTPGTQRTAILRHLVDQGCLVTDNDEEVYQPTPKAAAWAATQRKVFAEWRDRKMTRRAILTYEANVKAGHPVAYDFGGGWAKARFAALPMHERATAAFTEIYEGRATAADFQEEIDFMKASQYAGYKRWLQIIEEKEGATV